MLVLTRRPGESVVIEGRVVVKVLELRRRTVRLGIQAPKDISIVRKELLPGPGQPPGSIPAKLDRDNDRL